MSATHSEGHGRWAWWRTAGLALVLALAVGALYGQTRAFAFIWIDDRPYITNNPHVMRGLTWEGVWWSFTSLEHANWHPLTWLSHMLDVTLWGDWAGGHHLTNVLLHAANSVLVFLVVSELGLAGRVGPVRQIRLSAFWVALLFAVHPLRVESVAWVAERKDVLCAFFFLLALGAYARAARAKLEIGNWKLGYVLALAFFVLALLAKPMAVTLPFVMLLLDWWPLGRRMKDEGRRRKAAFRLHPFLREKLPFFALSLASCVVTAIAQREAMAPAQLIPFGHRFLNAAVSYVAYLGKVVWPYPLCFDYPYRFEIPWWQWAGSLALLVALSGFAWRVRRTRPYVLVGWLWYLGMLVPVIGIVQVGDQAMADRYAYLPTLGLFWSAVGWGWEAKSLRAGRVLAVAGLALAVVWGLLAHRQVLTWRDTISLYRHALAVAGPTEMTLVTLAGGLGEEGNREEAVALLEDALRYGANKVETLGYLGITLKSMGRYGEAAARAREALALKPDYLVAYGILGESLFATGAVEEAMATYREGLRRGPGTTYLLYDMGRAWERQGKAAEAEGCYREALRTDPRNWLQRLVLAEILWKQKKFEETQRELDQAAATLAATDGARRMMAHAETGFAIALAEAGRLEDASRVLTVAVARDPGSVEAWHRLLAVACRMEGGDIRRAAGGLYDALRASGFQDWEACNDLAWLWATQPSPFLRVPTAAVGLAEVAAARGAESAQPALLDTLAAAYASAGRFEDATNTAMRALGLAADQADTNLASAIRGRLNRYQRSEAACEPQPF